MLTASRSLALNASSGRKLPEVPALRDLYAYGDALRYGEVHMIYGRSGSQKSGFALWLTDELGDHGLDTLYFSADMSAFTASARIASKRTGLTTEEVERTMAEGGPDRDRILEALASSRVAFSFGSPITWRAIDEEMDAYVEVHDKFPDVIVADNLMDFEGAESDYTAQMAVMQAMTELARDTGSALLVMHHASDKSWDADKDPFSPPSRKEVKGGMSEKPYLSWGIALDPNTLDFKIATTKHRMGPQDATAKRWRTLRCTPELTRFARKN